MLRKKIHRPKRTVRFLLYATAFCTGSAILYCSKVSRLYFLPLPSRDQSITDICKGIPIKYNTHMLYLSVCRYRPVIIDHTRTDTKTAENLLLPHIALKTIITIHEAGTDHTNACQ